MSGDANNTVSDLEMMAAATNYRGWMFHRIAPYIGQRVLEVGAGIGNFTMLLLDRELVVAVDTYGPCVEALERRFASATNVVPIEANIARLAGDRLSHYRFDTIVCLNVLEHIEDDVRALDTMHDVLVDSGRLVLLVPAFGFLFGTVDRALQHHRRYTRRTLVPKLVAACFEIEKTFYMNLVGMAGWFLNNRVLKRREESPAQILLFDRFFAPYADRLEQFIRPPIGLSLIAVCRKR
jgi:SAM-dependent methyltransferase